MPIFFDIFSLKFTRLQILRGKYTELVQVCKGGNQEKNHFLICKTIILFR